jgi:hypothetical protein
LTSRPTDKIRLDDAESHPAMMKLKFDFNLRSTVIRGRGKDEK